MTCKCESRALILAALLVAAGCSEAIYLSAAHSPLVQSSTLQHGLILVRPLEDKRLPQMRRFVGSSGYERIGSAPSWDHALLLEGDQELAPLLTSYVADALRHAGYRAVLEAAPSSGSEGIEGADGVLAGRIEVFWLNRGDFAMWHHVRISLRLVEDATGSTRWQRVFESRRTRPWLPEAFFVQPGRSDYELVIRDALDKALSDMVDAFASSEFYAQLRSSETGSLPQR